MWQPLADAFPHGVGSEGGVIDVDEEHTLGARITLEKDGANAPWAITCGIYGWMFHTRFFAREAEAREQLARMKQGLEGILALLSTADGPDHRQAVSSAISTFVDKFP